MSDHATWTPPRSAISQNFSGLLDRQIGKYGMADLDAAGLQAFMEGTGHAVVLFTDEPDKVPESWDLAVIFPDVLAACGAPMRAAVLRPEQARAVQGRFGINRLPAILFLRDGGYVGAIEGLRDWAGYVEECKAMLQAPVTRPPSVGIAVMVEGLSACH